jgi:hypothetical protein
MRRFFAGSRYALAGDPLFWRSLLVFSNRFKRPAKISQHPQRHKIHADKRLDARNGSDKSGCAQVGAAQV